MDEFEQGGIDPQMRRFFKNIVSSFSFGALWMLLMAMSGFYFELALIQDRIRWYNVLFYVLFVGSLFLAASFFIPHLDKRIEILNKEQGILNDEL